MSKLGVKPWNSGDGLDGSSAQFQLSDNMHTVVYVNDSIERPPEIYRREKAKPAVKLSTFNDDIASRVSLTATEIAWASSDGATVRGWLLLPRSNEWSKPWPLITFVHGGPGAVYSNAFAPMFDAHPFTLEQYASNGMAVFIPNYSGTPTYDVPTNGKHQFAIDRPAEEILTGVHYIVSLGIADPKRLAIAGQSWGAWLGCPGSDA